MSPKWKGLLLRNRSKTLMRVIDCTLRAVIICIWESVFGVLENLKSSKNSENLFLERKSPEQVRFLGHIAVI